MGGPKAKIIVLTQKMYYAMFLSVQSKINSLNQITVNGKYRSMCDPTNQNQDHM